MPFLQNTEYGEWKTEGQNTEDGTDYRKSMSLRGNVSVMNTTKQSTFKVVSLESLS